MEQSPSQHERSNEINQELTEHEREEFERLLRTIQLSEGVFSVGFASFDDNEQINRIIKAITQQVPNVQVVDFKNMEEVQSFHNSLLAHTEQASPSAAIFKGFPSPNNPQTDNSQERRYFSAAREVIERSYKCLVLCVDLERNMASWMVSSPDWHRFRTARFNFSNQ